MLFIISKSNPWILPVLKKQKQKVSFFLKKRGRSTLCSNFPQILSQPVGFTDIGVVEINTLLTLKKSIYILGFFRKNVWRKLYLAIKDLVNFIFFSSLLLQPWLQPNCHAVLYNWPLEASHLLYLSSQDKNFYLTSNFCLLTVRFTVGV